ncbi:peptide chain release factor 1 [Mycoplasmoides pneumoniae]|uniref:peptide chain release factor 1 n=1 Tax=Mycoplasmoides pneumoniae TaxID=2104 RepID=UPI001330F38A|nr:peptide chain release factor 1 [Mycoplasmoides pneumoniae]
MEFDKQFFSSVEKIVELAEQLEKDLNKPDLTFEQIKAINKELKHKQPLVVKFKEFKRLIDQALEAEAILENNELKELHDEAKKELERVRIVVPEYEEALKLLLLPIDENNQKNVIVELRPAAGGDESCIFLADLFNMYRNFCTNKGWKLQINEMIPSSVGLNFVSFEVNGVDVFAKLKFESGVHRVQRVPATESKGRVHTSTVTVAVLPQLEAVEVHINPADLRVDTYRASGAGGQHVNRTESAVRITHLPTGIVVSCQEGKSQFTNRDTAMKMLRAKLWEKAQNEQLSTQAGLRKSQVGSGDRAEKIRTYNYPQNRVTDHRIKLTVNKLNTIILGDLDEIIEALQADEKKQQLENFFS